MAYNSMVNQKILFRLLKRFELLTRKPSYNRSCLYQIGYSSLRICLCMCLLKSGTSRKKIGYVSYPAAPPNYVTEWPLPTGQDAYLLLVIPHSSQITQQNKQTRDLNIFKPPNKRICLLKGLESQG